MTFWAKLVEVGPHFLPVLLAGFWISVQVALGAFIVALAGGLVLALLAASPLRLLRALAWAYIELMRGTYDALRARATDRRGSAGSRRRS